MIKSQGRKLYTIDGVHYFETKRAMEDWCRKTQKEIKMPPSVVPTKAVAKESFLPAIGLKVSKSTSSLPSSTKKKFAINEERIHSIKQISSPTGKHSKAIKSLKHYYKKGELVAFRSAEAGSDRISLIGTIIDDNGSASRSNNVTYHRIKRTESSGISRVERVSEFDIAPYEVWKQSLLRTVYDNIYTNYVRHGWDKLYALFLHWRKIEERQASATFIQRIFRGRLGRKFAIQLKIKMRKELKEKRRRQKEKQFNQRQAEKNAKREKRLKKIGISIDGKKFFETKHALEIWCEDQDRKRLLVRKAFSRLLNQALSTGWNRWKYVDAEMRAHQAKRRMREAQEAKRKLQEELTRHSNANGDGIPWHPAMGMGRFDALPYIGAQDRPDGTVEVLDINRYNNFKIRCKGPTDFCHYIHKPKILCGAYIDGEARLNAEKKTARSDCVSSLLLAAVNVYVCLMTPDELKELELDDHSNDGDGGIATITPATIPSSNSISKSTDKGEKENVDLAKKCISFKQRIRDQHRLIRKELKNGYGAAAMAHKMAIAASENSKRYASSERERNRKIQNMKANVEMRAKAALDAFPSEIVFLDFPIEKNSVPLETPFIELLEKIEGFLRDGHNVYVMSSDGHGRAPIVGACLLGRIFSMEIEKAIHFVKRSHEGRGDLQQRKNPCPISCPTTIEQQQFIRIILSNSEEMYKELLRKSGPETIVERRKFKRNMPGVPKLFPNEVENGVQE
eukprot:g3812.t1